MTASSDGDFSRPPVRSKDCHRFCELTLIIVRLRPDPIVTVSCVLEFVGSIYGVKLIWDISDVLIGLMVFPNIIGLLMLRHRVREVE